MGTRQQGLGKTRHLWFALAALAAIFLSHPIAAEPTKEVRRILILNEENATYPGIRIINQGIQAGLNDSPYQLQLYSEYMDTSLFPDQAVQQEFRDSYIRKYQNIKLDVIITVGPSPLKFMQEEHQRVFPGLPIVFCLPTLSATGLPTLDSDFTGVENYTAPAETVGIALRLVPGTRNVVVVGGVAPIDREVLANVKKELVSYEGRVEISYLTDLAMPDLLERLRRLPSNTIILLTSIGEDAAGTSFKSNESSPLIIGAASVPVFSLFDVHLNYGEVGGYLSSLSEQGKVAGAMALRILKGEKPESIPRLEGVNTYMFDWRALQRWGFKESNLPPGSIVLNREPTLWKRGWKYFIVGTAVIFLQAISILALFWHRARTRKVDAELAEAQHLAKLGSWRWDVATDTVTWSEELYRISGLDPNLPAPSYKDHSTFYTAESWNRLRRAVEEALNSGAPYELDLEMVRTDGTKRWLFARGETQRDAQGRIVQLHGTVQDITERKQAEEILSTMSQRLIEAHEEERAWIARELHDDFNQRIALMSVSLESLKGFSGSVAEAKADIREQMSALGRDIHALSHRLHSSKLDYLGLATACKGYCAEISALQNVEIEFHSENIPNGLSKEISLCLFRVQQEALQNAVKYSGVRNFHIVLKCTSGEVELSVSDSGSGFDPDEAINGHGLGLTSMKERLKLVDGQLVIKSKPGHGTTVHARVPLISKTVAARAGS